MTDAEKKLKARNKYINEWQKEKYYRLTILIPKEQKEELTQTAAEKGFKTVSDYVKFLIDQDKNPAATVDPVKDPENITDIFSSGLPFG